MSNRSGNFALISFIFSNVWLFFSVFFMTFQTKRIILMKILQNPKNFFQQLRKVEKIFQGISNNKAVLNQSLPMKFLKISSSINILFETSNYKSSGIMTFGFLYCKKKSLCHFKDKQQLISRNEPDFFNVEKDLQTIKKNSYCFERNFNRYLIVIATPFKKMHCPRIVGFQSGIFGL